MAGKRIAALLGLASTASAIHKKVSQHSQDASCACLGWHDAYTSHNAMCGDGHEIDIAGLPSFMYASVGGAMFAMNMPQLDGEICKEYFLSLPNDNFCQHRNRVANSESWCYVSPDCSEGTKASIPGNTREILPTKTCTEGKDSMLSDMKFEDFAAYAYKNKLEMALMTGFAYPTWEAKLPQVQTFFGLPAAPGSTPMSDEMRQKVQALVDSGKTTFLMSANGHPPFGVVEGQKLYYINFNPTRVGFEQKQDMNLWACVAGCGADNKELW